MKRLLIILSITCPLFSFLSCRDVPVDTTSPTAQATDSLQIRNIPWILTLASLGDSVLNLDEYEQFRFVVDDTLLFGDDGCRGYFGVAQLVGDSLTVSWIAKYERGCSGTKQFDADELVRHWRIGFLDTTIVLTAADAALHFSSRFINSITAYSFPDKRWRLFASNDTVIASLRSLDLLPELELTRDRRFILEWYFRHNPVLASNFVRGVFGVGDGKSICFYGPYGGYAHPDGLPETWSDLYFVDRIIHATHFSVSESRFTLERQSDGLFYEFVLDEK